jgi:hypothetical protein
MFRQILHPPNLPFLPVPRRAGNEKGRYLSFALKKSVQGMLKITAENNIARLT